MCIFAAAGAAAGAAIASGSTGATASSILGAAISTAGFGSTFDSMLASNKQSKYNYAAQHKSYMRSMEMKNMSDMFKLGQFKAQMSGAMAGSRFEHQKFMMNANHQRNMLMWEVQNKEEQLARSFEQERMSMTYGQDAMKNAFDAMGLDMELLMDRGEQTTASVIAENFARQREQNREEAKIRVSQGESGIFGNTAGREIMTSIMNADQDIGMNNFNLENHMKQLIAQGRKVESNYESRVNEAFSQTMTRYTGSMNTAIMEV